MPPVERRPRVAYLLTTADAGGGTERAVLTQATTMRDHWDVMVVSVFRDADDPFFSAAGIPVSYLVDRRAEPQPIVRSPATGLDEAKLAAAPSALVPQQWEPAFTALSDLALAQWFEAADVDVVMTTTPALLALAVQLAPERIVVVGQEHRAPESRGPDLPPLLQFGPRADALVTLTPVSAAWLSHRLAGSGADVRAIPNALLEATTRPRSSLREPMIMSAGRLVPGKQFDHLIRAFARVRAVHPEWRLRIYGEGPQLARLQRLAGQLGVSGSVELPGAEKSLVEEWPKASVFALTSRAEGQSLVMLEAAAAGLPLIAYDCATGPRDIVGDNERGVLVPLGDVDALAGALMRVVESPALRADLGARALSGMHRFEPRVVGEQWRQLVAGLLGSPAASTSRLGRSLTRAVADIRSAKAATDVIDVRDSDEGGPGTTSSNAAVVVSGASRLDVRARTLSRVTDMLSVLAVPFAVLPTQPDEATRVAVAASRADDVVEALLREWGGLALRVRPIGAGGGLLTEAAPSALPRDLLTGGAGLRVFERTTDGSGVRTFNAEAGCDLEWWRDPGSGVLAAPRVNRVVDALVPSDLSTEPGAASFATAHGPFWDDVRFPVDVVYTWVDGDDPEWLARRAAFDGEAALPNAAAAHRFTDHEELRYSLRSIHEFAPWVRRIFVVTDRQRPRWLREDERLTVVDHTELFGDYGALPTFNSHAIESVIDRIDGLSEHFVYFNDDVFLGAPTSAETFFTAGGITRFFPSSTKVNWNPTDEPHLRAARNVRELLRQDFGVSITRGMLHVPHALRRSLMAELRERYTDAFVRTAAQRFRSPDDIAPVSSLYPHYAYLTGRGVGSTLRYSIANLGSPDLPQRLAALLRDRGSTVFCLGDSDAGAWEPQELDGMVASFLQGYFPFPSPWEL